MRVTTNIPGNPEVQFQVTRGEGGTPIIEVATDCQPWKDAMLSDPTIAVVRTSDLEIMLAADGAQLRMRGQVEAEHNWLAGWDGQEVDCKEVRGKVRLFIKLKPEVANEGDRMMTPIVGGNRLSYDQMEIGDLITECARRGINVYQSGPSVFVRGSGAGAQPLQKHHLVNVLRTHDNQSAKTPGKSSELIGADLTNGEQAG